MDTHTIANDVTNVAAGGAIVSPWWLPAIAGVSEFAAIILPILGAIWLAVQIWAKVTEVRRGKVK